MRPVLGHTRTVRSTRSVSRVRSSPGSVPARGHHAGGALVPALRPVLPRRRGTARRAWHRGRPRHGVPVGAAVHPAVRRGRPALPARRRPLVRRRDLCEGHGAGATCTGRSTSSARSSTCSLDSRRDARRPAGSSSGRWPWRPTPVEVVTDRAASTRAARGAVPAAWHPPSGTPTTGSRPTTAGSRPGSDRCAGSNGTAPRGSSPPDTRSSRTSAAATTNSRSTCRAHRVAVAFTELAPRSDQPQASRFRCALVFGQRNSALPPVVPQPPHNATVPSGVMRSTGRAIPTGLE